MNAYNAQHLDFLPADDRAVYTDRESFALTGVAVRTTNAAEAGASGRIPGLWQAYYRSGLAVEPGIRNPHLIYALYTDYESDASGAYTLVIGHESAPASEKSSGEESEPFGSGPERLRAFVPGGRYRVFQTRKGPFGEVVAEAWADIWAHFERSSERRAYTGDFELYDTRGFDPAAAQARIYIAIR
ncbi:GyrI-like domain-containing protein [Saccharibacillus alkalitolerans]|uniref:AraC family transcriptional regulator n=1 Tax=Saccharibacillus alkalitolerans TaxID=2705290 RepID=A0ABX0F624_9BACL|nr:effector binding domain-containing protein [Saccharibacillus alkalitolerans]NGZ76396.1 AraC family transcriptional regulator [Saccharibacillus alkalitolerans]